MTRNLLKRKKKEKGLLHRRGENGRRRKPYLKSTLSAYVEEEERAYSFHMKKMASEERKSRELSTLFLASSLPHFTLSLLYYYSSAPCSDTEAEGRMTRRQRKVKHTCCLRLLPRTLHISFSPAFILKEEA